MGFKISDFIIKKQTYGERILRIVEKAGPKGLTLGVIKNRVRSIGEMSAESLIEQLVDDGSLNAEAVENNGNGVNTIRFTIRRIV